MWDPHSQVIYWWTSTQKDDDSIYVIACNGGVFPKGKGLAMGSLALRAVRPLSEE